MDYLIHGRAAPGAGDEDTPGLDEAHWSYLDAFADRMGTRGPTLSPDRTSWTGSLHVVDLADADAAHAFAAQDPYQRAGLFRDHLVRRFDDLLRALPGPRPTRDTVADGGDVPFLVLAAGAAAPGGTDRGPSPAVVSRLVLWGALHPADAGADLTGSTPVGTAVVVLAADAGAARALLAAEPVLGAGGTPEVHAWEFGGRR